MDIPVAATPLSKAREGCGIWEGEGEGEGGDEASIARGSERVG